MAWFVKQLNQAEFPVGQSRPSGSGVNYKERLVNTATVTL